MEMMMFIQIISFCSEASRLYSYRMDLAITLLPRLANFSVILHENNSIHLIYNIGT